MIRARAIPPIDQLEQGDERIVLVPGRAVRVVGIAVPLLDLVPRWTELGDIVAGLERLLGAAPGGEGESLVMTALQELGAEGLVEIATG